MTRTHHRYSAELKQRLVEEIEQGQLSLRAAARDAQTSVAMVQKWLEEFGRFKPKRDIVEVVMKSEQDKIAALEKALADAHLKLLVYDELIVQANKRYKTDLKKSFGMSPRGPSVSADGTAASARSAGSSRAPATPTTSAGDARPRGGKRTRS